MLVMVFLFAVGSAMCGAAPSLNFLIASRSSCRLQIRCLRYLTASIFSSSRNWSRWYCILDANHYCGSCASSGKRHIQRISCDVGLSISLAVTEN